MRKYALFGRYLRVSCRTRRIGIFRAEADGSFAQVTSVQADLIDVLDSRTNGRRDLRPGSLTGELTVTWTGSDYIGP